jgi:hypothetical protein
MTARRGANCCERRALLRIGDSRLIYASAQTSQPVGSVTVQCEGTTPSDVVDEIEKGNRAQAAR